MQQKFSIEERLKNSLKSIQAQQDLSQHQDLIARISVELEISVLDCAAAMLFLNQPKLNNHNESPDVKKEKPEVARISIRQKWVRYRMDVGQKHKVILDEIINVLVEVSGVDRKAIGRMDIRNHFTLVELPEGMPADIFQLLSETEINHQKLNIKRVKFHRRSYRRNNKQQSKA